MFNFDEIHGSISKIMKKELFFIVGAPKSGTTWLQYLLNGHPDICCKGESHLGNVFSKEFSELMHAHNNLIRSKNTMLYGDDQGYPIFSAEHINYLFASIAALLFYAQQGNEEYKCIGEKTPDHIMCLDLLTFLFARAKIIHIIRDGRDCAVSGWFHIYRDSPEWAKKTYPTFYDYVQRFANAWPNLVYPGISFGSKNPTRYLMIKYEELHKDITANLIKVLEFLNMKITNDIIKQCEGSGSFERLSKGRKRGEEDCNSFYRKGIVSDWRNHFDEKCMIAFENAAGTLLKQLGYGAN
jgi:hypothetical protein